MKRKFLILMLLLVCIKSYSKDYTIEELNELKKQGLLSTEDYNILKSEIVLDKNRLEYFTLSVNGKKVSNDYRVLYTKEGQYFNLNEFFKAINFGNHKKTKDGYEFFLGKTLRKVVLNVKENKLIEDNKEKIYREKLILINNNEVYMSSKVFKQIFLTNLNIDTDYLKISMGLNFMTPKEIDETLDIEAEKIESKNDETILMFKGKRQMFDLGYARVTLDRSFTKSKGESSYQGEWNSGIEYQGGLFYGQLKTKYDFEDDNIEYVSLEYNNMLGGHSLTIENRGSKHSAREWSFSFFKDKGYYTDGNKAIIRETVPVGSRVELRYMGASIAIQNEKNGSVVFDDDIIKTDRTYELLIYTPDGRILKKTIQTINDYDKQDKNEIQYTILVNENDDAKRYTKDFNFFYGLTDSLTIGGGYTQGVETINDSYKYTNDGTASIVYGNTINGYSYVLNLSLDKSFDSYVEKSEGSEDRSYKDKFQYDGTAQLNVGNFKYVLNHTQYGEFYDQKKEQSFEVQWDALESLSLGYTYGRTINYDGTREKTSNASIDINQNYKGVLISLGVQMDEKKKKSYNVGLYYTGKNNISTKLQTQWTSGKEEDMETTLTFYNNNFLGLLDYNFEIGYSQMYKDKVTFSFTMNYDNWLKIASTFSKEGEQTHSIGLDRVIDLKNPTANINSVDVSRVKTIAYIDENNNNKYDKGEKRVEGVEITLGKKMRKTDEDGEATFGNISNGIIYDLKPKIKKPSFTIGDNKIQIKSDFSSTVIAYIPIKPMVNLTGIVKIDEGLSLTEQEKEQLYDDILIEIKDAKGNSLDLTVPDNTGAFDISGLFPEQYIIEVQYIGTKFNVPGLTKKLTLFYLDDKDFENKVVFEFEMNKIVAKN